MTMTDLATFLLERIAEDEAWSQDVEFPSDPNRAMAECEAKRRIVDCATNMHTSGPDWDEACRFLAFPYADHPDYREEWRP